MSRSNTSAKPCDELESADFDRDPLWGFDFEIGESNPDADETWVRPLELTGFDDIRDGLFLRGQLRSEQSAKPPLPCLVTLTRRMDPRSLKRDPLPQIDGLALWTPSYKYFQIVGEADLATAQLRKHRPALYWTEMFTNIATFDLETSTATMRSRLDEEDHAALAANLRDAGSPLPVIYEAVLPVGDRQIKISGRLAHPPERS